MFQSEFHLRSDKIKQPKISRNKKKRSFNLKDLILTPLGLRMANKLLPCVIGKYGVSKFKQEGDGKTFWKTSRCGHAI